MNERTALNLTEKFPDWVAEYGLKEGADKGAHAWGAIKAAISVSKIQWFIHILYSKGYEIRKK